MSRISTSLSFRVLDRARVQNIMVPNMCANSTASGRRSCARISSRRVAARCKPSVCTRTDATSCGPYANFAFATAFSSSATAHTARRYSLCIINIPFTAPW